MIPDVDKRTAVLAAETGSLSYLTFEEGHL
jgi:hypothetical protein